MRSLLPALALTIALAAPTFADARQAPASAPLQHDDITWLRRTGFGIDSATLARSQQLGRARYLDEALAGNDDDVPPAIARRIAGYEAVSTPPMPLLARYREQNRQVAAMPDGDARVAARKAARKQGRALLEQARQTELLRAVYGGNPVKEQMVWFWLNHFSIYGNKGPVRLFAADYEEHVIRPHALGKFRDLVMATLKSPAMLVFLDNAQNARDKINENYARELMELHTLGVHGGYTQQDVQALAHILTGVGLARPGILRHSRRGNRLARMHPELVSDGLFEFNPARHDAGDKTFLGHTIHGGGFDEVERAVDLIVSQPACAQFVSRQLAQYFLADNPPKAVVDAMADTFQRSDGDIAAVLRTLFTSTAFTDAGQRKFKDPFRYVVSAMRFSLDGRPISNVQPLVGALAQMGEPIYGRVTPDGWPLDGNSWSGSGQMAKRFDVAGMIGSGRGHLFDPEGTARPYPRDTRPDPPTLDGPLFRQAFAPWLSTPTRAALAKAKNRREWNVFLLSSPDFNYR